MIIIKVDEVKEENRREGIKERPFSYFILISISDDKINLQLPLREFLFSSQRI